MYRTAWSSLVVLVGAFGAWAACATWTIGGALLVLVTAGAAAACIVLLAATGSAPPRWRPVARVGLVWGAGTVSGAGLVAWLGGTGVLVVLLLAVSSPFCLGLLRGTRRNRSRSGPARAPLAAERPPHHAISASLEGPWMRRAVAEMDLGALCRAWRTSYLPLQEAATGPLRLRIVARRQELLDELERRNPTGFDAWLASGARAAGDPTRWVTPSRGSVDRHDQR